MATRQQIAAFVEWYFTDIPRSNVAAYEDGYRFRNTAAQYAKQLGSTVEFEALNLGQFFGSPDGQLIRTGVALVFPGYLAGDIDLIVDALMLAARAQARNKRIAVAPLIGLAAVGVGKLIYDANAA